MARKTKPNTHRVEVDPGIGSAPGKLLLKGEECNKSTFAHLHKGKDLEARWLAMIKKGMLVPLVQENK